MNQLPENERVSSKIDEEVEYVNVHNNPEGMSRLIGLGAQRVPVVSIGDKYVYGIHIEEVVKFIGKPLEKQSKLPPDQLIEKLNLVITETQSYIRQVPDDAFEMLAVEGRDRSVRQLGYHIFNLGELFVDTCGGQELTAESMNNPVPDSIRTGERIVEYGEKVRQRINEWWARQNNELPKQNVTTYYGSVPVYDLLDRTTWHMGDHTQQIKSFLTGIGITPD